MTKEKLPNNETSRGLRLLATVASTTVLFLLSHAAFSWKSRQEILHRDGCKCVECGSTENLHAAHISHDKSDPRYDDPSNGRTLCGTGSENNCHLKDHENRSLSSLGLTEAANNWAKNILGGTWWD